MSVSRTQELQSLYQSVDDIDLFVGIFSERPMRDAMVGPTALCIIGKYQLLWIFPLSPSLLLIRFMILLNWKFDCRWPICQTEKRWSVFYDLAGQPGQFSASQLQEIRKTSMSRILCDNSGVSQMQPFAFLAPESFNPIISCQKTTAIPRPSLEPWRQNNQLRNGWIFMSNVQCNS